MTDQDKALVPPASSAFASYQAELQEFESGLMGFIGRHGLPTTNVLVPVAERVKVFNNVGDVFTLLTPEYKRSSVYVSKFVSAAASGLFDAALNYLWDETIYELRKRIVRYDLEYFFDLAVTNPDKRKKLSIEEDLAQLDDSELIRGASEIGLISELGFRHLDFIRYMRNWASAAHPNQNQITGLQLVGWFETCIREVITLPETNSTARIKTLLANIKAHALDAAAANQVGGFFVEMSPDQCSNLMAGLFGIYTNETSLPLARDNVKLLSARLWPFVGESMRNTIGLKYGQFTANNDALRAKWAREFIDSVGAASHIPEPIRMAEIGTAVDELLVAHRGFNNFHIEPSFARRLESLVGERGSIPAPVAERYVEGLTEVFLTNGYGITHAADPIYLRLLGKLDATQALLAVLSFRKMPISSKLQFSLGATKYRQLLELAKAKVTSPQGVDILNIIEGYKSPLQNLRSETILMKKVDAITKSLGF
jgi:hypothetical protein